MSESYVDIVKRLVLKKKPGEPILSSEIAKKLENKYNLSPKQATANTCVALKRIMDRNLIPDLRHYHKGLYYLTKETPDGELGLDKSKVVESRYIAGDNGYYGGESLFYEFGLTDEEPTQREVVTNKSGEYSRRVPEYDIYICPPHTEITKQNKDYLKVLDTLEMMSKRGESSSEPYAVLSKHTKDKKMDFERLLAYADKFYTKNTVFQLAKVARKGVFPEDEGSDE